MVTSKSRLLTLIALMLIGSTILVTSLSVLGYFDPVAKNKPGWQRKLTPMQIPAKTKGIRWLTDDLPPSPYSVRVAAHYDSGDLDSGYGILLGQENSNVAVMVSPLGYVSIWQEPISASMKTRNSFLPWQTWPHVRTGDSINEILLILNGDTLSARVNHEWLWEGQVIENVQRIGIIGKSYGRDSFINFQLAEISTIPYAK